MKKLKAAILTAAVALAAVGFTACGGTPSEPDKFSVAFESAWGGVFETQTVVDGERAEKPEDPVRVGYTFDGWYLDGALYAFTDPVTSDITLVAKYSSILGGDGTETNPFTIDSAAELELFKSYADAGEAEFVSASYVQTADITSTLTAPVATFGGSYDGGGHSLKTSVPVFDKLGGTVKNLGVEGAANSNAQSSGKLANVAENATISRVTASGSMDGTDTVGGLVGTLVGGRMEYCTSTAKVTGLTAGGLVGKSSGVIINGIVNGEVVSSDLAGGIVAEMQNGALVQNVGFSGKANGSTAGGIVGLKNSGGVIYRGFVYGETVIGVGISGAIAGSITFDFSGHTDITECYAVNDVTVIGTKINTYIGQNAVNDLGNLTLPSAVWTVTDGVPALKSTLAALPTSVNVNVNGSVKSAEYGSHENRELFTADDVHFSTLIELDTDVELKTAMRLHTTYNGMEFTSGGATVSMKLAGAEIKTGGGEYKEFEYVNTFAHTEKLLYTPDFKDPSSAYYVDYDAPVSVYTDGEKYYAFTVSKQYVATGMYMAFMRSYVLADGVASAATVGSDSAWKFDREWNPKNEYGGGAYKYTVKPLLSAPITYLFIIDDDYSVDGDDGYYLTRFVMRVAGDDGKYTESREVISQGQTVMYLGDKATNAPVTAFSYFVDYEGYSNFFYRNADGKLVSSEGVEITDATNDFLVGTWFDGSDKYDFDTKTQTVAVTSGGNVAPVPYTVKNGKIEFTVSGKAYSLALTPSRFGSYTLKDTSGDNALVMATYMNGALDGAWITENGDVVTVASEPNAFVTFNGSAATSANEAVYNGLQAVTFTVGNKEYYLVTDADNGVVKLVADGKTVYAYDKSMIVEDFAGEFV